MVNVVPPCRIAVSNSFPSFFFFWWCLPAACCLLSMAMDVLGTVVGTCWEAKREPT